MAFLVRRPREFLAVQLALVGALVAACLALVVVAVEGDGENEGRDVVSRIRIEGAAMEPALTIGEFVDVLDYRDAIPERGDIVAFYAPLSPERVFVKRIIGLPGDTVEIDEAREVLLNGVVLDEPYTQGTTDCNARCKWTIPELGAAGARPAVSDEFRSPVSIDPPFDGDAFDSLIVLCADVGCYFVMGDNRQNSSDSRAGWPVPAQNIIGHIEAD